MRRQNMTHFNDFSCQVCVIEWTLCCGTFFKFNKEIFSTAVHSPNVLTNSNLHSSWLKANTNTFTFCVMIITKMLDLGMTEGKIRCPKMQTGLSKHFCQELGWLWCFTSIKTYMSNNMCSEFSQIWQELNLHPWVTTKQWRFAFCCQGL